MNTGAGRAGEALDAVVRRALYEDVGAGDVTTQATVPESASARAHIVARAPGIVAGMQLAHAAFAHLSDRVRWQPERADGDPVSQDDVVVRLQGPARALLTAERTALNFLQRMSGVATLTRRYVDAVQGTGVRIVDTRKTTPGLRAAEKAAVRAGGGHNHRSGLYDMVLIKENHVVMAGGIGPAVAVARRAAPAGMLVEVEVRDADELEQALDVRPDRIMLDNMSLEQMRAAAGRANRLGERRPLLEASGNMSLERVRQVAETGVDEISVGALTHSAPALDLSLLLELG